jgi:hypothetical protein
MARSREFDYDTLPWDEIMKLYRQGWGWFGLAERFGCPDHKTLARRARARYPNLVQRDLAEAQRARRLLEKNPAAAARRAGE